MKPFDKTTDPWHCFEVGDRAHVAGELLANTLQYHAGATTEERAKIDQAVELLAEVYQSAMARVGQYAKD